MGFNQLSKFCFQNNIQIEFMMAMQSSFSFVQTKNIGALLVAGCPAMDLVAIVGNDGFLSVYRTLSW